MASETKRRRWLPAPFSRRATIVWAVIVAVLLVAGAYFMYDRLANGLGMAGATNSVPWGLWVVVYIWFSGLAGGLYLLSALVYLLRIPRFAPVARMALGLSVVSLVVSMIFIGIDLGAIRHSLGTLLFFHWSSPLAWEIKAYMFFMVVAVAQFVLVLLNDKRAAEAAGEPSMESLRRRGNVNLAIRVLAGVGVALKLVMALGGEKRYHALFQEYADLAAVGTVADVMKLLGENRTIVRVGLNHLKKTRRRGLYALMVEAGTLNRAINSTTVGYCLSPRINAAGRMGQAAMAVELILTENTHQAETMAHALCELNRQRQAVELEVFNQCLAMLAGRKQYDCLVLADKAWHQGVVGIVASRLAEQYACPVFMICLQEDGRGKGSCRSCKNFNLFSALEQCADLLEDYGGHALAAGFTIREENIPAFRTRMREIVRTDMGGEELVSTLQIDGEIPNTALLTVEEVEGLSMLEPYGAGNPKPVFSLSGVTVTCMSDVGGGRHLKMRASRDGRTVDMIFFSMTRAKSGLNVGDRADVAFYPQINDYRGSRTVQLHLVDLRPSYTAQQVSEQALYRKFARGEAISPYEARQMIPQREEFAAVWRYLASHSGDVTEIPVSLARKIAKENDLWESTLRTMVCLEVLESFGLVTIQKGEGGTLHIRLRKRREGGKLAFYQSPIIQRLQTIAWGEGGRSSPRS